MHHFTKIFEHLFVLELSSVLAGPLAGTFFAELGAKVVKIENKISGGDVTRTFKGKGEMHSIDTAYYRSCNWGKESLFLDLNDSEDYKTFIELAQKADIIISNYLPNTAVKLKIDLPTIKAVNPKVLFGQILGYTSNPNRPAYDIVLQAEAGYIAMTGTSDGQHAKIPVPLLDVLAAHQLKEGLIVAYIAKLRDGKSRQVTVSLFDVAISSLTNQGANYLLNGNIPEKLGTRHPHIPIYGQVFTSKDNIEFVVAAASDLHYNKIYNHFDFPEDLRAVTSVERKEKDNKIIQCMNNKFRRLLFVDICSELDRIRIPFGEIRNIKQVFETLDGQNLIEEDLNYTNKGKKTACRVPTNIFRISPLD